MRILSRVITALALGCFAGAAGALELFTPAPVAKATRPAPPHIVNALAVEFDAASLGAMRPGESAGFTLPDGRRYEVVLERLERHEGGDLSWAGHVRGESVDRHVVITVGAGGTYGTFTLPDGNWGVLPAAGHDWLFDADASDLPIDRTRPTDAMVHPELLDPARPKAAGDPAACETPITSRPTPQQTIDVLFAMAPDFVSAHGGAVNASTRLNNLIATINTYYANSRIAVTLRRVAAINVPYPSAASQDALPCDGNNDADACDSKALNHLGAGTSAFSHLPVMRNLYGADMVVLMRGPRGGGGISGVAWIGGYNRTSMAGSGNSMFAVAGDAPGFSGVLLAHELGHNMGNHHDPSNSYTTVYGATSYGYGYTYCGAGSGPSCPSQPGFNSAGSGGFGTIMSYWRPTVPRFSNPNDTCSHNGSPTVACGGVISSASPSFSALTDETRTINCTRAAIGAMRTAHVPDCASPGLDGDRDGMPDCVERALGRSLAARDNDIFSATPTSTLLFAMQQYRDFLSREPDADGAHYWARSLGTNTTTRMQMVDGFVGSAEFQGAIAPVARLYFAYFLRIPDYAGLQHWIGQFRSGATLGAISQSFASSAEFANRYGALSNRQFVSLVYNNVLGRAPDAAGLDHWTRQLDTRAIDRGGLMLQFSESPEYAVIIRHKVYVTMLYMGMLRREPDAGGFDHWVRTLDAGNTAGALIDSFLGSVEYRNRFLA